ncbi:MAG TPA: Mur ligase family protein, partial [Candidatus Saccharimonadales bacterium]|nr:Mur ligase family protein [Candidatus Saccharimonadales bacterium]
QLKEGNKVLIFEYGEGKPGDIKKLADFSLPHYGIITGLAPAHLDAYASLEAVADDFAYMNAAVGAPNLYINGTSELLRAKLDGNYYDQSGIPGWRTDDIKINFSGTDFTLSNQDRKLELHTGLLGKHQVGPLSAAVALAAKLGLNDKHIIAGVAATVPFEHRMQPRQLHGAWIIDDTYNGNIEGMRAGLELLATLPGKRKIYVTPGLVDQGEETEKIHHELGTLIATAQPDKVVLMNNSVADYISASMHAGRFKGELVVEKDPLGFYTNIEHYVAAGDVILLQNDWPDSYQ